MTDDRHRDKRDFGSEEAESVAEAAVAGRLIADEEIEPVGKPASLWSDAWKELRTSPLFIVSAILIVVMIIMAVFWASGSNRPSPMGGHKSIIAPMPHCATKAAKKISMFCAVFTRPIRRCGKCWPKTA